MCGASRMADVEFVIPGKTEDLCALIDGQYVVSDVSSGRELTGEVLGLRQNLDDDGIKFIFNHFDAFYSVIRHFNTVEERTRTEATEVLFTAARKMTSYLETLLNEGSELNEPKIRFRCRNMMKMYIYLLCKFAESYETEAMKPSLVAKKFRKKKKQEETGWDMLRHDFVQCITQLYALPINKLWEPPIVEMEFVNMVTLNFFKMLENTNVTQDKELCDRIIDFLGSSVRTHKNELGYAVKIIQLAQDNPHLPPVLSKAVHVFVEKYGARFMVSRIIKELSCLDSETMLRDTARAHSLSQFVVEVAMKCPREVLMCVKAMMIFLEEESHIMRNCVLTVISELLIKIASFEEIESDVAELRDELIERLLDHMLDVNAFVRSKVLQLASNLLEQSALPVKVHNLFLEKACARATKDRTSSVRKNGVVFLKTFLQVNPYCAQIDVEELRSSYEKENATLLEMMPDCLNVSQRNIIQFDSDDDEFPDAEDAGGKTNGEKTTINGEKTITNGAADEHAIEDIPSEEKENMENQSHEDVQPLDEEIAKQQILVQYLKRTLQQAELLNGTVPKLVRLLKSKLVSDVIEAIDFFTSAFQLGLRKAVVGIKEMMHLIYSKEPAIKSAAVAAYKALYLSVEDDDEIKNAPELMAKNLILFLQGVSETEVDALGEFVKEFVRKGDITGEILKVLWDIFTYTMPDVTDLERLSSIIILSMAGATDRDIIIRNFNNLITYGFGPESENDFQLVRETCIALMNINGRRKPSETNVEFRLPPDDKLFLRLQDILVNGVTQVDDSQWCSMAQRAVELIFSVADHPEGICETIIQKITDVLHSLWETEDENQTLGTCVFCRYLSLVGHVAYCIVLYCETDLFSELKRRELTLRDIVAKKKASEEIQMASKKASKEEENDEGQCLDADDVIADFINKLIENELLAEENVLGMAFDVVIKTCRWSLQNQDSEISAAASLALSKFMFIRPDICRKNMQLLVTIMEKSSEPYVRSNLIIAMADLIKRFPNEVEPWTPYMYKRLRDEDSSVRKNTIIILMHLILRDMVKVKGQIGEIAICIVDPLKEISNVARHLFQELSKRKNTLFNLLPDVISALSDSSSQLSEEDFQGVIRFLFKFIEKDRHIEGLVEKLCHRFKDTKEPRQLHELAFALELLNFNEKSFRKLVESKAFFKDMLDDEVLAKSMRNIMINLKRQFTKLECEVDAFMEEMKL